LTTKAPYKVKNRKHHAFAPVKEPPIPVAWPIAHAVQLIAYTRLRFGVQHGDSSSAAGGYVREVDGIRIVDQPQHLQVFAGPVTDLLLAVFKISRTRPPLG
jgi:hypothetical protein